MTDKRIEALTKAAAQKKQEALEKTEKAIQELIKKKHKITIRSVAREADVSVSYIYKYPELSYRIQTLREQQKHYPVKPQSPSSKSHQVITTQLRNRIKILEHEKEELSKEIKILAANVYEMNKSENSVERLKAENIQLKGEVKSLEEELNFVKKQLSEARDFILNQGYKNKSNKINKKQSRNEKVIQLIPKEYEDEQVVVPAILSGQPVSEMNELDDEIQYLLSELGIRLSKTLIEEIKSKPREQVINAIYVVKENIDTGVRIRSKVGLFRSALKKEWVANESPEERKSNHDKDQFPEWYNIAKELGMVRESKMTDEGMAVYKLGDGWVLVNELIEQGWTLEYLKQRMKKK